MGNPDKRHDEAIISLFNQNFRWWLDVYREDLPRGFFSFEMRQRRESVTELLSAEIRKKEKPEVLECGCGAGDLLERLAPLPCKLTGLDLNRSYLDITAEKVPQATLVDGNLEKLPFPDASFDVVFAVGVFQYLSDERTAAKEICRVTKDDGFVLIAFANYRMLHLFLDPYYWIRMCKKIMGIETQGSKAKAEEIEIRRYPLSQLRRLFSDYGMHEIESLCTSYGPLKFWRREYLPLTASIRMSQALRRGSEVRLFSNLKHVGNHLILTLRKGSTSETDKTLDERKP